MAYNTQLENRVQVFLFTNRCLVALLSNGRVCMAELSAVEGKWLSLTGGASGKALASLQHAWSYQADQR